LALDVYLNAELIRLVDEPCGEANVASNAMYLDMSNVLKTDAENDDIGNDGL